MPVVPSVSAWCVYLYAPKFDETGQPMFLAVQRLLMGGIRQILWPHNQVLPYLSREPSVIWKENRPAEGSAQELEFNFCGCVLATTYADSQRLIKNWLDLAVMLLLIFGVRDRKIPDKRAMGFPFDRLPRDGADCFSKSIYTNMACFTSSLRHDANRIVQPRQTLYSKEHGLASFIKFRRNKYTHHAETLGTTGIINVDGVSERRMLQVNWEFKSKFEFKLISSCTTPVYMFNIVYVVL
ncbi:hypothetical protein DOY81_010716, partial [Sarcophaga bullata]